MSRAPATNAALEHLSRLQELTAALAAAATPGEVAELVTGKGRRTLNADTAAFYALSDDGPLVLVAQHGVPAHQLDGLRVLTPELPLPGPLVVRTKTPLFIESFAQYAEQFPELAERMRAARRMPCLAVLPMLVGERVLGVVGFGFTEERTFDEGDRSYATTLAQACAQAFDRARLLDGERRMHAGFRLLANAGAVLSSSLEYETTLENVVRLAMPKLADFCFFDVREDDGAVRRIAGAHEDPELLAILRTTQWAPSPPELEVCALSSGRTGYHPLIDEPWMMRIAAGPEHLALLKRLQLRSLVTVPLCHRERPIGALTLCFGSSERRHSADDVELAEELARRAALAVAHARLYRQAEQANRAKDVFLGIVSHELRTPLTAILGWASVLEDPGRRAVRDIDEPLRVIHQSAVTLARLVDDILDVSRVIAGKFEIARQPVSISAVVSAAIETVAPALDEKSLELEIAAPAEGLVIGDPHRLLQVVTNLLTNAIKFSFESGKIVITIEERADRVLLTVRDSGRGIERADLARIFDTFRQADSSTTRSHGGLGLGLAIVRELVELHSGTVVAESDGIGKGATFVVELPRATVTAFAPEPSSRGFAAGRLDGRSVLVVDDQPDARELTAAILRRHGAEVSTAESAAQAMALFESLRPDVLLSDIAMPVEDGYSLIQRVRELERQGNRGRCFAAAFTAYAGEADRVVALQVGYDLHLAKPIEPSELIQQLYRKLIGRARRSA